MLFLLLFTTLHSVSVNALTLTSGLSRTEYSCKVQGRRMDFEELRLERGKGLEIRAWWNPTAVRNPRCRADYGGLDLERLLKSQPPHDFEVLGATNGTVFRVLERRQSDGTRVRGYVSNQMLWSKKRGLIAPLRRLGGGHIFVVDEAGGHELLMKFEKSFVRVTPSLTQTRAPLGIETFLNHLQIRYPTMTLALQSNMPMSGDTSYTHCPSDSAGNPRNGGDWRCLNLARTALCGRSDGSVSLITTAGAFPEDLSTALGLHGPCQAECSILFNLDGGGSTQLAYLTKKSEWATSGSRMETSQPGCSPYRPVDNYLVIGRPR
jgi:hypothetical protein